MVKPLPSGCMVTSAVSGCASSPALTVTLVMVPEMGLRCWHLPHSPVILRYHLSASGDCLTGNPDSVPWKYPSAAVPWYPVLLSAGYFVYPVRSASSGSAPSGMVLFSLLFCLSASALLASASAFTFSSYAFTLSGLLLINACRSLISD